ncbi:HoxN/HupN/NixA family nickel/cobalt transporter [Staphylococcus aureus]
MLLQQAISFIGILSLPILFASGMSLLDTLDGVVMKYAYNSVSSILFAKSITI